MIIPLYMLHNSHLLLYNSNVLINLVNDTGSGSRYDVNKGYYYYIEDYIKLKMMNFTQTLKVVTIQ